MVTIRLDQIQVASPCSRSWESMKGDDKVRFCDDCQLNVYNFAAMSQRDGEALIVAKEGKLCGRIWRRADGTTLTKDCPVGLRAIKRRARWMVGKIAAAALLALSSAVWVFGDSQQREEGPHSLASTLPGRPFIVLRKWINPPNVMLQAAGRIAAPRQSNR